MTCHFLFNWQYGNEYCYVFGACKTYVKYKLTVTPLSNKGLQEYVLSEDKRKFKFMQCQNGTVWQ